MSEIDETFSIRHETGVAPPVIRPLLNIPARPRIETHSPPSFEAIPVAQTSARTSIPVSPVPTTQMGTEPTPSLPDLPTALMAAGPITPLSDLPTRLLPTLKKEFRPSGLDAAVKKRSFQFAPRGFHVSSRWAALEKLATIPVKIIQNVWYTNTSTLVGPLQEGQEIHYIHVFSRAQKVALWIFTALNILTTSGLIGWMLWPTNFTDSDVVSNVVAVIVTLLMALTEGIRFAQSAALIFFAQQAKDPIALRPKSGQRVAVLTTIVPGKEPLDLVLKTLHAMKNITYDGVVDVWLLDEGNSPVVKAACEAMGVKHFSRKDIPAFNQPSGSFRAKTKHGNHNAWRARNEHNYDIVAQMDPDHVPTRDFLQRTVGYFNDPDVGFVVAPQVYGNLAENWIAKGSAMLAYVFHGIIQRGGNGHHAPLLIGTNHLYRTACFRQIDGYQDCIIEDHLTSMVVFATRNPATGKYWKGVYTPDIVAVGEGPTSFTDFFSQQMRWAYGIWEIATTFSAKLLPHMQKPQQLSFLLLQMFYPSVALTWLLSNCVTIAYLLLGVHVHQVIGTWTVLWSSSVTSSIGLFFWLRRFNLVKHEQRDSGLVGMALMLMCIPIYTEAALRRLSGKPLSYVVTAKGTLTSGDSIRTFSPHLKWATLLAGILILNLLGIGSSYPSLRMWLCLNLSICLGPILLHLCSRFRQQFAHTKQQAIRLSEQ